MISTRSGWEWLRTICTKRKRNDKCFVPLSDEHSSNIVRTMLALCSHYVGTMLVRCCSSLGSLKRVKISNLDIPRMASSSSLYPSAEGKRLKWDAPIIIAMLKDFMNDSSSWPLLEAEVLKQQPNGSGVPKSTRGPLLK